jgi:hypothetical protein
MVSSSDAVQRGFRPDVRHRIPDRDVRWVGNRQCRRGDLRDGQIKHEVDLQGACIHIVGVLTGQTVDVQVQFMPIEI